MLEPRDDFLLCHSYASWIITRCPVSPEDPQYSIEKRINVGATGLDDTATLDAIAIKQADSLGRVSADYRIGISTIPVTIQDKTFQLTVDTGSPRL